MPQTEGGRPAGALTRERVTFVVVSAAALAWVLAVAGKTASLRPGHPDWTRPWDHEKYRALAAAPFDMPVAPFRWRLGVPLVADALPFDTARSFELLSIGAVWLTAVSLFVLLRRLAFGDQLATVGTMLFLTFGWLTGYPLYNIWLPDAVVGLVVVVLASAALDRRPVRFALVLLLGTCVKEQALLAGVLWYTLGADRLIDRRRLVTTAVLGAPALAALAALRVLLPSGPIDPAVLAGAGIGSNRWDTLAQDPGTLFAAFGQGRVALYPVLALDWTIGAFGVVALLALVGLRHDARAVVPWVPYLALVYAQPLFASNTKRLVALAFPVVVIMALHGLTALRRRLRLHPAVVLAVAPVLLVPDQLAGTNVRIAVECLAVGTLLLGGALVPRVATRLGERVPGRRRRRGDAPPRPPALGRAGRHLASVP